MLRPLRTGYSINSLYPKFATKTGWRMHGEYEPLTPEQRSKLADMYRLFNRRLERILGRKFHGWDT